MKRVFVITGALLALAGLSGCVPTFGPVAEPSGSGSASATSTSTPTPSAAPTPGASKPTVSELVLEPGGVSTLRIGSPVPATSAALALVTWNPAHCPDFPAADAGGWDTTYPKDPGAELGAGDVFTIDTVDRVQTGPIAAIQTFAPQLRTATGIHVGSSMTELAAAYPGGFAAQLHGEYSTAYAIDGPGGRLLFEVYDGSAAAEGRTTVAIITAVPAGTAPFTFIPGDGVVGTCA